MIRLFLFLLAIPMFATVACDGAKTWNGTTCSGSKPDTYTITGSAGVGTNSEILAAYNDAECGDTILLEAGTVWSFTTGLIMQGRPCTGGGSITFTTTQFAKLPNDGTRITKPYIPLLPIMRENATGVIPFNLAGSTRPASNITFRGLAFDRNTALAPSVRGEAAFQIGSNGAGRGASEYASTTPFAETTVTGACDAGTNTCVVADASWATIGLKIAASAGSGGYHPVDFPSGEHESRIITNVVGNTITVNSNWAKTHVAGRPVAIVVTSDAHQPENITIQHCVFSTQDMLATQARWIYAQGRSTVIKDNFLEGTMLPLNGESQAILGYTGPGPYTITNNYIQANGENIMFGGTPGSYQVVPSNITLKYNVFHKTFERQRVGLWNWTQSNYAAVIPESENWTQDARPIARLRFRGAFVTSAATPSTYFYALNTGYVGTTEPAWTSITTGQTISDGVGFSSTGCTGTEPDAVAGNFVCWYRYGTGRPLDKNNFEIKSAQNLLMQYNMFDWFGEMYSYNAQQSMQVIIKAGVIPHTWDGWPSCIDGATTWELGCHLGATENIQFLNNYMRSYSGGLALSGTQNGYPPLAVGNYIARGNLLEQTEPHTSSPWRCFYFGTSSSDAATNLVVSVDGLNVDNNTCYSPFITSSATSQFWLERAGTAQWNAPRSMIGNIFPRGAGGVNGSGLTADGNATTLGLFPGTTNFIRNAIIGSPSVATTNYPSGEILSNCPTTAACAQPDAWDYNHPTYGKLFRSVANRNFRIRPTHGYAFRTMPDGSSMGADIEQLPLVEHFRVTPTDRQVLITYRPTPAIEAIPCVVELNDRVDMFGNFVAEQAPANIGTYYRQDADDADRFLRHGNRRMIVIGHSVNLTASTKYYGRLHCGGYFKRFSFTTLPTLSSTTSHPVSRPATNAAAASMVVEYGTTYSRSTGEISNGGTATVNCTVGTQCTVSFTATLGVPYYFRWVEKSAVAGGGTTLATGRVGVIAITQ